MTLVFRRFALLLLIAVLSGCASPLYYAQAISGQLEILAKRRPVEEVLSDPATPDVLDEEKRRRRMGSPLRRPSS